ncbi:MAG: DNA primase, partial [Candidatus Omnitrophica bacterium]|nr:DNA primase [Candidatus Omnitrophota bacterium]
MYYYGQDDLKNKFIVIAEKEGSKGSDYPLRELISKKSITKAIPMKDQITGQIKTVSIRVNGPIALVETTTNGEINPENLNRCFIISIDETEEQTRLIHHSQRLNYTLENHLKNMRLNKIIEKHIYAQRLLKKIHIFNPYAPLLTFPSSRLQSRRDNEKFLKLIRVICFLHQYQHKVKKHKLDNNEVVEYIECTINDYKIAYELLSDGILDNTLDDLPRPARELLDIIKKYLKTKSETENIPMDKIIFERKEIRDYSS